MKSISRRNVLRTLSLAAVTCWPGQGTEGNETDFADNNGATLFEDVRLCEGRRWALSAPCSVHLDGTTLATSEKLIVEPGTVVVGGRGRTLMPGFLAAQALAMSRWLPWRPLVALSEWTYIVPSPAPEAEVALGVVIVPRIWPAEAFANFGRWASNGVCGGLAEAKLRRSLVLAVSDRPFTICDPAGPTLLPVGQLPRDLAVSAKWGNGVLVHALTAHAIKADIARATSANCAA